MRGPECRCLLWSLDFTSLANSGASPRRYGLIGPSVRFWRGTLELVLGSSFWLAAESLVLKVVVPFHRPFGVNGLREGERQLSSWTKVVPSS